MKHFSDPTIRYDLWLRIQDLAEEILALTHEWRDSDPELKQIDLVSEEDPPNYDTSFRDDPSGDDEDEDITF